MATTRVERAEAAGDLLAYLRHWLNDYGGPSELVMSLERSSERSECGVAWVTAEGPDAFGHLTLWESGEVAVEVYDGATGAVLLRYRGRVRTVRELAPHLRDYVQRCCPATTRDRDDEKRDLSTRARSGDSSPNRRLHL
jgi:hypothetical protein